MIPSADRSTHAPSLRLRRSSAVADLCNTEIGATRLSCSWSIGRRCFAIKTTVPRRCEFRALYRFISEVPRGDASTHPDANYTGLFSPVVGPHGDPSFGLAAPSECDTYAFVTVLTL
jgi:hypothetical protein